MRVLYKQLMFFFSDSLGFSMRKHQNVTPVLSCVWQTLLASHKRSLGLLSAESRSWHSSPLTQTKEMNHVSLMICANRSCLAQGLTPHPGVGLIFNLLPHCPHSILLAPASANIFFLAISSALELARLLSPKAQCLIPCDQSFPLCWWNNGGKEEESKRRRKGEEEEIPFASFWVMRKSVRFKWGTQEACLGGTIKSYRVCLLGWPYL